MAISASTVDNINTLTSKASTNTSATDAAAKAAGTNYQDFLKLLTTQLQNQDPSAPTDTNQLTQQIATLSQVEQQINTNKNLETLVSLFNSTTLNSVVNYIGKQVETDGNQGALQNGKATFVYNLPSAATTANVTISDAQGNVVLNASGTKLAGRNEVYWDGTNSAGTKVADGTYTIAVDAKDANGNAIVATTSTVGVVSSVDSKAGAVTLSLGDIVVPLNKVQSVTMPVTAVNVPTTAGTNTPATTATN